MERATKKITSNEDSLRVVRAYEQGKNMKEISELLQVKHSTAHGIIKKYRETGVVAATVRTPPNTKKLDEQQIACVIPLLDEEYFCPSILKDSVRWPMTAILLSENRNRARPVPIFFRLVFLCQSEDLNICLFLISEYKIFLKNGLEDDLLLMTVAALFATELQRKRRSKWSKSMFIKRRMLSHTNMMEELRLEPNDWLNFARMDEDSYLWLLQEVTPYILKQDTVMRSAVTPHRASTRACDNSATGVSATDLCSPEVATQSKIAQVGHLACQKCRRNSGRHRVAALDDLVNVFVATFCDITKRPLFVCKNGHCRGLFNEKEF